MKKFILSVALLVTFSTSVHAFVPQIHYFLNRDVAVARVWNTSFRPIVCYGTAFGRTWNGVVLNSWFNNLVIYPSASVDVYVHSNYYDPFVQAWANIDCRYTW